jgi:phage recombination protein Bet
MSNATALAVRADQTEWTKEQSNALKAMGVHADSAGSAQVFLSYCQNTGLDPFQKQIYLTKQGVIVGIDGLRSIALRTGEFQGRTGPFWCGPDGEWHDMWLDQSTPPAAAKVGVLRAGFTEPVYGIAMWSEFGSKTATWGKMPAHMLAKVAESHALRAAFPTDMSGIFTREEMQGADAGRQEQAVNGGGGSKAKRTPRRPAPTPPPSPDDLEPLELDTVTGEIVADGAELLDPEELN